MGEIDISKCPACHNYNVFGGIDKPCCYLYHKYCDEVDACNFKDIYNQLQQSNQKLDKIKELTITGNCLECDDELCTKTNLTCEEIRFNKIKELIINNNGQHI